MLGGDPGSISRSPSQGDHQAPSRLAAKPQSPPGTAPLRVTQGAWLHLKGYSASQHGSSPGRTFVLRARAGPHPAALRTNSCLWAQGPLLEMLDMETGSAAWKASPELLSCLRPLKQPLKEQLCVQGSGVGVLGVHGVADMSLEVWGTLPDSRPPGPLISGPLVHCGALWSLCADLEAGCPAQEQSWERPGGTGLSLCSAEEQGSLTPPASPSGTGRPWPWPCSELTETSGTRATRCS